MKKLEKLILEEITKIKKEESEPGLNLEKLIREELNKAISERVVPGQPYRPPYTMGELEGPTVERIKKAIAGAIANQKGIYVDKVRKSEKSKTAGKADLIYTIELVLPDESAAPKEF